MDSTLLGELADEERELQEFVEGAVGTMTAKERALRDAGVFARYARVFERYLDLAARPECDIEALKRATFLAWYEVAEPACFSGVADLPDDARQRVVDLIEAHATRLDSEFRWMLASYHAFADHALPTSGAPQLAAIIASERPDAWKAHLSGLDRMNERGLMGDYWRSVFTSRATQR